MRAMKTWGPVMVESVDLAKKKVQVGNDQEKVQSERNSHSKNRGGKKLNGQLGTYTKKTFRKPCEQLFPIRVIRQPLSNPNLTKNMTRTQWRLISHLHRAK